MFSVAPYISWSDVEGELVLFDGRDQSYLTLNSSASDIWRGLARDVPVETLADELAADSGADRALVADQLGAFVEEAIAKGLLVLAPTA
jgi:hypothetical protein